MRSWIFNENFYLSCDIWNCIFLYSTNTYFWIRKSPKHVFHHVDTKQISAPPPPAFPLGSFSKYSQTRLFDSTKRYSGLKFLHRRFQQKIWIMISFLFRDEIKIFLILWFETWSRFDNGVVGHGVGRGFGHGVGYGVGHCVLHWVSLF